MYLRTVKFEGEVENVYLGKSYTKVDFTTLDPKSQYAQAFLKEADRITNEEPGIAINLFLGVKDSIMIVSESGEQYWLDTRDSHYIVGPDGKTFEKITPKFMEMADWCEILDKFAEK